MNNPEAGISPRDLVISHNVSRKTSTRDTHERRVTTSLSLVLPMYNESESADHTLRQALASLDAHFLDFEIVVADDGSTDDSAKKVRRWCERDSRIVLVSCHRNQRFGGALRRGLAAASKDVIIYTDFDLPVALDFFPEVVKRLETVDVLTGYSAEQAKNLSWSSKLLSRGYNQLVSAFFRLPIRDVNFGFKAMRRCLCEQLRLGSSSPFVDAEMFLEARRLGHSIAEVPVPFTRRQYGVSRIRRLNVVAWTLLDMLVWGLLGTLVHHRERQPPWKFSLVGVGCAFTTIAAVSGACYRLDIPVGTTALALLFAILVIARLVGLASGLAASAFATIALLFALPPPRSFEVNRPVDWLLLAIFALSAALGSRLMSTPESYSSKPN